jgi:hypothetical protein
MPLETPGTAPRDDALLDPKHRFQIDEQKQLRTKAG